MCTEFHLILKTHLEFLLILKSHLECRFFLSKAYQPGRISNAWIHPALIAKISYRGHFLVGHWQRVLVPFAPLAEKSLHQPRPPIRVLRSLVSCALAGSEVGRNYITTRKTRQ